MHTHWASDGETCTLSMALAVFCSPLPCNLPPLTPPDVLTSRQSTIFLLQQCTVNSPGPPDSFPESWNDSLPKPTVLQYKNSRLLASCTTHCSPSCRLMPVIALHAIIVHLCVLIASSRSPCRALFVLSCTAYALCHWPDNLSPMPTDELTCRTSSSVIAPDTSLLFLNTSKLAPVSRCSFCLSHVLPLSRYGKPTYLFQQ